MPHVSRIDIDKKLETELFESLETALGKLSKAETKEFLLSFLSPTEKLMLAKRFAIIILLKENVSSTTIANTLHVTLETVARTRLKSQLTGNGYEIALKKLENEKFIKDFKDSLLKIAGYSIRAASGHVKLTIT